MRAIAPDCSRWIPRVEGLARTLADAALTRQVIVFTHDDRLREAVRRLGLPATVHSVTRRSKSVVEVRQISDPVTSLIEDARAVALTEDLPQDVASRVVPGFCRMAVEAACMESVRRRRLARGEDGAGKNSIGGHFLAQQGLTWYNPMHSLAR